MWELRGKERGLEGLAAGSLLQGRLRRSYRQVALGAPGPQPSSWASPGRRMCPLGAQSWQSPCSLLSGTLAEEGAQGRGLRPGPCRGHQPSRPARPSPGEETCSSPVAAGEIFRGDGGRLWAGSADRHADRSWPGATLQSRSRAASPDGQRLSAVHQGSLGATFFEPGPDPRPTDWTGRGRRAAGHPGKPWSTGWPWMSSSSFGTSSSGPKRGPCKMQERAAA